MQIKSLTPILLLGLCTALFSPCTGAEEALEDAAEIVARANLASYYSGIDGRAEARMRILDAQGREQRRGFTVIRRDITEGADQEFLVVFSQPADVRNTVFLVRKHVDQDDDRWLYLPGLDLVKRISAGDKRTSFVGSHFYYEDVSGRLPNEDTHELLDTTDSHYLLQHTPKDPSSVEFARYTTLINRVTFLPELIEYSDAAGKPIRRVEALEFTDVQGYPVVVHSRVSDLQTGGYTETQMRFISYDLGIPADVFSERSLRKPPQQWLQRPREE